MLIEQLQNIMRAEAGDFQGMDLLNPAVLTIRRAGSTETTT